jgi:hypothetical protein
VCAQEKPLTPEEQEAKTFEAIQKETDRLALLLNLEDWQIFYVDSTLTHNVFAMQKELKDLGDSKFSNSSIYYDVQDKWAQATYDSYQRFLNEAQWAKYLKNGAAREQKSRERRREKNAGK